MVWTRFMDMHSGGGTKEPFGLCFIEAPMEEAIEAFEAIFGHHPYRVTCDCCGEDYSISPDSTLEEATAFDRKKVPMADFLADPHVIEWGKRVEVRIITADELAAADH